MKEKYIRPEVELTEFVCDDVITNSMPFVPYDMNYNGIPDIDEE